MECAVDADIAVVVRVAAEHGLPVTVWGGRRDVYGRNAGDGAVVIDLRHRREIVLNPEGQTVRVGGGATVRDLVTALPADRAAVTTTNPDVGVVGAAVGGGYGPLLPRFGLVADNLLSARLVLADGSTVMAAPGDDDELLWGLRGGGAGFGVVTEATFATHPLDRMLCAIVTVPLATSVVALLTAQSLLDEEPDALAVLPLFTGGPDDVAGLNLVVHWTGGTDGGERVLRALEGLTGAATVLNQWVSYGGSFGTDEDALWPLGHRWSMGTRTVPRLDQDVAEILTETVRAMPSPRSRLFLHDFHGAPTRIAPEATAFPQRRAHFVAAASVPVTPGDDAAWERALAWSDSLTQALDSHALPGGYVNFLGPADTHRVSAFYGDSLARLEDLKKRLDPSWIFRQVTGVGGLGHERR
ncbi:FAD-binding protein [Streptomyces sp. NPDC001928]|uniref:FAD-binding oxidoreductase n=1 Tax=Streptomyces sp. NPDC001928 TaxID=3154404 RepID=UPI0033234CE7